MHCWPVWRARKIARQWNCGKPQFAIRVARTDPFAASIVAAPCSDVMPPDTTTKGRERIAANPGGSAADR
jgi:hypothetical protein